ncbi:hypothetical protein [Nocardia niigatensis]
MSTCGTEAGYFRHYRRKETACRRCKTAHSAASKVRRTRPGLCHDDVVQIGSALFTAMYLEVPPARQIEVEVVVGRDTIDALVKRYDQQVTV